MCKMGIIAATYACYKVKMSQYMRSAEHVIKQSLKVVIVTMVTYRRESHETMM